MSFNIIPGTVVCLTGFLGIGAVPYGVRRLIEGEWPVRRTYFQQCCDRRMRDGFGVVTKREVAVQAMFDQLHAEAAQRTGGGGGH